jgi:hypothetical protein
MTASKQATAMPKPSLPTNLNNDGCGLHFITTVLLPKGLAPQALPHSHTVRMAHNLTVGIISAKFNADFRHNGRLTEGAFPRCEL